MYVCIRVAARFFALVQLTPFDTKGESSCYLIIRNTPSARLRCRATESPPDKFACRCRTLAHIHSAVSATPSGAPESTFGATHSQHRCVYISGRRIASLHAQVLGQPSVADCAPCDILFPNCDLCTWDCSTHRHSGGWCDVTRTFAGAAADDNGCCSCWQQHCFLVIWPPTL